MRNKPNEVCELTVANFSRLLRLRLINEMGTSQKEEVSVYEVDNDRHSMVVTTTYLLTLAPVNTRQHKLHNSMRRVSGNTIDLDTGRGDRSGVDNVLRRS
jgi:hypothetical protein